MSLRNTRAWVVVFSAALFFFYEFVQMTMFGSIGNQLMDAFHLHATGLGQLSAVYFLANVIFLFPAGWLLDHFSTRRIILLALGLCVTSTFLFAQTHDLLLAQIYRFLTGIGSAFCFLCTIRLASRWFRANHMALITGLIVTVAMLGGMVAQTPLTYLIEQFGWRAAIAINATLGLVFWCIILAFVYDYPADYSHLRKKELADHLSMGPWGGLKIALLNQKNWLAGIGTAFLNVGPIYLLGALWGDLYLEHIAHFTPIQASYVTSMIYLGMIIGAPSIGVLSDYSHQRRLPMLIANILAFFLTLPLLIGPQWPLSTYMGWFFLLGFLSSTQVLSYPWIMELNPKSLTASAVSVISICCIGSGFVLQPLPGWFLDYTSRHHQYDMHAFFHAFLLLPASFVISFVALWALKEPSAEEIARNEEGYANHE